MLRQGGATTRTSTRDRSVVLALARTTSAPRATEREQVGTTEKFRHDREFFVAIDFSVFYHDMEISVATNLSRPSVAIEISQSQRNSSVGPARER